MHKKIFVVMALIYHALNGFAALEHESEGAAPHQYLHPSQRPQSVKDHGQRLYGRIKDHGGSGWGCFNGSTAYGLLGIKDENLIINYVQRGYAAGQTEFVFMDVGAGDFSWSSKGVMDTLKAHFESLEGVSFMVIGVRGETAAEVDKTIQYRKRLAHGKIYMGATFQTIEIGNFKIDDFSSEMHRLGFGEFMNGIDLIVSHWGTVHLADPVGTIVEIYDWLKPKTGMFLSSAFYGVGVTEDELTKNSEEKSLYSRQQSLLSIFLHGNAGFLEAGYTEHLNLPDVLIVRTDDCPLNLPFSYHDTIKLGDRACTKSNTMQRFVRRDHPSDDTSHHREGASIAAAPFTGPRQYSLDGKDVGALYINMPPEAQQFLNRLGRKAEMADWRTQGWWNVISASHQFLRLVFHTMERELHAHLQILDGLPSSPAQQGMQESHDEEAFLFKINATWIKRMLANQDNLGLLYLLRKAAQ